MNPSTLELKIPPLIVALLMGAAMWLIAYLLPALRVHLPLRPLLATAVLVVAITITTIAVFGFRKAGTTVDPMHPEAASSVVTTGIYRFTRNPMYLGFLLALVAYAIFLAHPAAVFVPLVFIVYMNRWQIGPEERALRARFSAPYEAYLSTVRRWL